MAKVLIVEDDEVIGRGMASHLALAGFDPLLVEQGEKGLARLRYERPDACVLDLMLPGLDGMEVTQRLRAGSSVPIIILTARDSVADRVAGLERGADDYLVKPFAFEELLARIRVQLRRHQARDTGEMLRFGPLTVDLAAHEVRLGERRVDFTAKEFELLELFIRHPRQVLTRDLLYERIWGYDFGGESNVIEVYIRALRQKLEAAGASRLIHTVRGVGYVLREDT
jgi:two-component system response regulator MprA